MQERERETERERGSEQRGSQVGLILSQRQKEMYALKFCHAVRVGSLVICICASTRM
jgi:hypothetical protein